MKGDQDRLHSDGWSSFQGKQNNRHKSEAWKYTGAGEGSWREHTVGGAVGTARELYSKLCILKGNREP